LIDADVQAPAMKQLERTRRRLAYGFLAWARDIACGRIDWSLTP